MNQILNEDFEYLYAQKLPWEKLNEKCILVTGGTGLIGSLLIKFMDFISRVKDGSIRIYTIVRNRKKAEEILQGI